MRAPRWLVPLLLLALIAGPADARLWAPRPGDATWANSFTLDLEEDSFNRTLANLPSEHVVLMEFFAPWCGSFGKTRGARGGRGGGGVESVFHLVRAAADTGEDAVPPVPQGIGNCFLCAAAPVSPLSASSPLSPPSAGAPRVKSSAPSTRGWPPTSTWTPSASPPM